MPKDIIHFQSYCWSIGTTSFRTKDFNYSIERQISLISDFWNIPQNADQDWTPKIQERYYNHLLSAGFLNTNAHNKPKDARQKTSGLVDIGLLSHSRRLTEVGQTLLTMSREGNFVSDNPLQIPSDSFLYLKQLLKTSCAINNSPVRPLIVLLYLLSKTNYLTLDEFTFLLPLCINKDITDSMPQRINDIRCGKKCIDDIIADVVLKMNHYQHALSVWNRNKVTANLFKIVGINRKSQNADKKYYHLYSALKTIYLNKIDSDSILAFYNRIQKCLNGHIKNLWLKHFFGDANARAIKKNPALHFKTWFSTYTFDEETYKQSFIKMLHLQKIKATLLDYRDLNRRYLKLTDIFLFNGETVILDLVPRCFFCSVIKELYKDAFTSSPSLPSDIRLKEISSCLAVSESDIIKLINLSIDKEKVGKVKTISDATRLIHSSRHGRFINLINAKFTKSVLLQLLKYFENYQTSAQKIQSLVTDNADLPTIFEYVLAIIWFTISDKNGDILRYMKMSLDADMLPKTHASGGCADIVYEYKASGNYPQHALLIEATLTSQSNQRRSEMEPVSRHLGDYLIETGSSFSYCLFISNSIHINVLSDFRSRKMTSYYNSVDKTQNISGMKIIPLATSELQRILEKNISYENLYILFEKAFQDKSLSPIDWYQESIVKPIERLS